MIKQTKSISFILKNTDKFLLKFSSCSRRRAHKFFQNKTYAFGLGLTLFFIFSPASTFAATTAATSTLSDGLVGYWTFDGSGATAANTMNPNSSGTLVGNPQWTSGLSGGALRFNGQNNYVVVPDSSNFRPSTITVSAAVNIDATIGYIALKSAGSGSTYELDNSVHSSKNFEFCSDNKGTYICATTPNTSYLNKWTLVSGQYDGHNLSIWINGVKKSSKAAPALDYTGSSQLYIGGSPAAGKTVNGSIDSVTIYNRPITAKEATQLYTAVKGGSGSGTSPAGTSNSNNSNTSNSSGNNTLGQQANSMPFQLYDSNGNPIHDPLTGPLPPPAAVNVSGASGAAGTSAGTTGAAGSAADPHKTKDVYTGLVKCSGVVSNSGETECNFNTIMTTITSLVNWLFVISIPIAIALFAYAGVLYISGIEKNITKAHGVFQKTFIGFIIMLVAFTAVHTLVSWFVSPSIGAESLLQVSK